MATPPGRHVADQLRSLSSILDETDHVLRRGRPAGAAVWPTGLPLLDATLTGGLRSGELVLLGGPAGHGKTTLGVQIARNVVDAGRSAVVMSYEHEAHTLFERLVAMEAAEAVGSTAVTEAMGVHDVRRALESGSGGRSLEEVLAAMPGGAGALAGLSGHGDRLQIHESSGATTTVQEIAAVVDRVTRETGLPPLVLVDYVQKVPAPGESEVERSTAAAEGLKDLALEMRVPVVAISAADKQALAAGHRMRTHDLRGSSALAYEADVVLIVNDKVDVVSREHLVYDLGNMQRYRDWSVLTIEKNRHGRAHVDLEFAKDFEHGRFHREGGIVSERLIDERVVVS